MQKFLKLLVAATFACACAATVAYAHAFLDKAVPAVGGTVTGSPSELTLSFTQDIVIAFSGVSVAGPGGEAVPVGKPSLAAPNTMHVHLSRPLKPGTYLVSWHVVSVDTHPTSGTYRFTVAP
jgi:copper resistance protein C